MGDMTVLQMMKEARLCFVSGHFIEAILLATSLIEQTLSEELEGVASAQERRTLELMKVGAPALATAQRPAR